MTDDIMEAWDETVRAARVRYFDMLLARAEAWEGAPPPELLDRIERLLAFELSAPTNSGVSPSTEEAHD